ncbi:hypothetical protein ACOSQ3_002456 [Xanthoceras sorbifolium]
MLEEMERDVFLLFIVRREPIPLNTDSSHMQASNARAEPVSEDSLARTSSLEDAKTKRSSLYIDQMPDSFNVSAYKPRQLIFSRKNPSFLDCKPNVVTNSHLHHYKEYYELPNVVKLILPDGKAAWNPLGGMVAIYGLMLNCGVMLPLQPFIARFLSDVNLAPV